MSKSHSRFMQEPSPEYLNAVQVLRELAQKETLDHALRAWAESCADEHRKAWAEVYGLKESKGHVCLTRFLGKQCDSVNCLRAPGDDHRSLWIKHGKPVVYVYQPYGLRGEDALSLGDFARKHGLYLDIDTLPAWHFPGRALQVELWAVDPSKLRAEEIEKEQSQNGKRK